MNTLEQLHYIEEHTCIYNIHYCSAGVGFIFYEGPIEFEPNWPEYLTVYNYHPTFEEAVEAEYIRLNN